MIGKKIVSMILGQTIGKVGFFMIISFLRAIFLYIAIIAAIRLMGKRQISELQTSDWSLPC